MSARIAYCVCGHAEPFHYGPGRGCNDRVSNEARTAAVPCPCSAYRDPRIVLA